MPDIEPASTGGRPCATIPTPTPAFWETRSSAVWKLEKIRPVSSYRRSYPTAERRYV